MFTKRTLFYYLAIMLMSSAFLPLVFNNLPPIIRSHHVWTLIWGLSLILFAPKVFAEKIMIYVLIYGLFLSLMFTVFWINIDDWNKKMLITEYYQVALGVSVFAYFKNTGNIISFAKVTKWSLIFLLITAIMTIISSIIDPLYARKIVSSSAIIQESSRRAILSIQRFGGGGYGTGAAFMSLFPLLIYYFKFNHNKTITKKQIVIYCTVIFFALIGLQIFTYIFLSTLFGILAFFGFKKIRKSLIISIILFTITLSIPNYIYVNTLLSLSNLFEKQTDIKYKLNDLAIFIELGADFNAESTGTGGRVQRYNQLLESFIKSPIIGVFFNSDNNAYGYFNYQTKVQVEGTHLHWMNKITTTGIVGLLFFSFILYYHTKNNLRFCNEEYKFFFLLASFSIISCGFFKTLVGREVWYTFFIIVPGMQYLPILNTKNFEIKS